MNLLLDWLWFLKDILQSPGFIIFSTKIPNETCFGLYANFKRAPELLQDPLVLESMTPCDQCVCSIVVLHFRVDFCFASVHRCYVHILVIHIQVSKVPPNTTGFQIFPM